VIAGATNVSALASTRTDDGRVLVTYDPIADACPSVVVRFTG
jgi:hypothetical protein